MTVTSLLKAIGSIVSLSAFQTVPTAFVILSIGIALALFLWGASLVLTSYSKIIEAKKGRK